MRFENIKLESLDLDTGNNILDGTYSVPATDELIEITNNIRKRKGNTDLVTVNDDNDVYYNFYLYFDVEKNKEIKLHAVCNYGEKDDNVWYEISLFPEEKEMLMFKIIKELVNELE